MQRSERLIALLCSPHSLLALLLFSFQRLDIGGCSRLSDGSINALCAAYASSLTHLDLRGLTRLTDRSIDAIVAHCYKKGASEQTLQELNLSACSGVSHERIYELRRMWPQLSVVT